MRLSLIFLCINQLSAQEAPEHRVQTLDVILAAGALAAYAVPHVVSINDHPPSCAPCDRQSVLWLDRWAIVEPRDAMDIASTAVVTLLAAGVATDLGRRGPERWGEVAYVAESAGWALGASALIKAVVARKRPVLYTADAAAAASDPDAQRSWPSSHAAVAAALTTGYLLISRDRPAPAWRRWGALGSAAAVGALRVAAGRHFPTDVAGGAALGVVSAITVRAIRF